MGIVCVMRESDRPISARLWVVMMAEFARNGGRMLSFGKIAFLRRQIARGRLRHVALSADNVAATADLATSIRLSRRREIACLDL